MFKIYEKSLRLFTAPFIFIYGVVKPWQFENAYAATATPVNELDGMSLMWAFFGYSLIVPVVIGIFECTGAVLLFFDKTKLLGALILLPVLVNVVLFDIVYEVLPFATINGIIYLTIIVFVCFEQRRRLAKAFSIMLCENDSNKPKAAFSFGRVFTMIGFLGLNWFLFLLVHALGRDWLP